MLDPRLAAQLDRLAERLGLPEEARREVAGWLDQVLGAETLASHLVGPPRSEPDVAPSVAEEERYERIALLGRGGRGEVWRVRDRVLQRILALKVLHPRGPARPTDLLEEARAAARLRHPAIVTVYDVGVQADGALFYTMEEVAGETLLQRLRSLSADERRGPPMRRMVAAVAQVAQGLAFAHDQGVVHRDVKPQNIALGPYGEVRLLDFGVGVLGTPAYLAPERLEGRPASPASDQYAVGATLYHVLSGAAPYVGDSQEVLTALGERPPPAIVGPDELVAIVNRAMDRDPAARFAGCGALADALLGFLEGARAEDRARALLDEARRLAPGIEALRSEARALRLAARQRLHEIPLYAPVTDKEPAWAMEEQARARTEEAARTEVRLLQALQLAEREAPHLDPVHQALADHWQARHAELEATHDPADDAALTWVRIHDRGTHARYLRGLGSISLRTEPEGARALLFAVDRSNRRWRHRFVRDLGRTPLVGVPVDHGDYVVAALAPGFAPARVPLVVGRLAEVDPRDPEGRPLVVPLVRDLGPDDRYVPAGWFRCGTDDALQRDGMPVRDAWLDGFVLRRFPVSNAEYLAYLDARAAEGREELAWKHAPRVGGEPAVERVDGRFALRPDAEGDVWGPDWPVCMVDWDDAVAYAAWMADRTGLPWRLPWELEWEKAGVGADGRRYPWGNAFEDTWCNMRNARPAAFPSDNRSHPLDRSPYGVRGLAGNLTDWCQDPYVATGPRIEPSGRFRPEPDAEGVTRRSVRGGSWSFHAGGCHLGYRQWALVGERRHITTLRLARSV